MDTTIQMIYDVFTEAKRRKLEAFKEKYCFMERLRKELRGEYQAKLEEEVRRKYQL